MPVIGLVDSTSSDVHANLPPKNLPCARHGTACRYKHGSSTVMCYPGFIHRALA
jgi:hypothetical protein